MSDESAEVSAIGVFGGTFDPPHAAHVMLAAYVLAVAEIDRLLVVPGWSHPLEKQAHAEFAHRHRMCELAFADIARVTVSRIEEELGGTSYTLETLEELRWRHPDTTLRLIIGSDILGEVDRWHRFDRVVEIAPPIVIGRSGYDTRAFDSLPISLPPISSTEVRAKLAAGEPVTGLLPRTVEAYARARGLYATGAAQ